LITGIEEQIPDFGQILFMPNPVNDYLKVNFNHEAERKIRLYAVTGILLIDQKNQKKEAIVDFTNFPVGLYLLNVEHKGTIKTFKIVKQ